MKTKTDKTGLWLLFILALVVGIAGFLIGGMGAYGLYQDITTHSSLLLIIVDTAVAIAGFSVTGVSIYFMFGHG